MYTRSACGHGLKMRIVVAHLNSKNSAHLWKAFRNAIQECTRHPSPAPQRWAGSDTKTGGRNAGDARNAQCPPVIPSENARQRTRMGGGVFPAKAPTGAPARRRGRFVATHLRLLELLILQQRPRWQPRFHQTSLPEFCDSCVDARYIGVVMSLPHVTFLTYVKIMSHRPRLKMITPVRHPRSKQ